MFSLGTNAQIPDLIKKHMQLRVLQKNCQKEWINIEKEYKEIDLKKEGQKLHFAPCSNWGYNMNYSIFLSISDPQGKVFLVKPLYFIRYATYKGIYSDELLSNIVWNQENLELTSFKTFNGTKYCGERSAYIWDFAAQDFKLKGIIKSDNCQTQDAWQKLNIQWFDI